MNMIAEDVIATLGLQPHPEGGHFSETYRDTKQINGRAVSTAIYYLLKAGEVSAWHRIDAAEIWHYYAGDTSVLTVSRDGKSTESHRLGTDIINGERPQMIVPAGAWQSVKPAGAWTLMGCTVAPGFEFERFELAPDGWVPGES